MTDLLEAALPPAWTPERLAALVARQTVRTWPGGAVLDRHDPVLFAAAVEVCCAAGLLIRGADGELLDPARPEVPLYLGTILPAAWKLAADHGPRDIADLLDLLAALLPPESPLAAPLAAPHPPGPGPGQ